MGALLPFVLVALVMFVLYSMYKRSKQTPPAINQQRPSRSYPAKINCAVCGRKPDPTIYRPGVMVHFGDFSKCSKCHKVYCQSCSEKRYLSPGSSISVNICPVDKEDLVVDIFS